MPARGIAAANLKLKMALVLPNHHPSLPDSIRQSILLTKKIDHRNRVYPISALLSAQVGMNPTCGSSPRETSWQTQFNFCQLCSTLPRHSDPPPGGFRARQIGMRGLHAGKPSCDVVWEGRSLAGRHVNVQRHVLGGRRNETLAPVEQLLEIVHALGIVVEQLKGHLHRVASRVARADSAHAPRRCSRNAGAS